jgi:glycogen(starch) synthase
MALDVLLVGDYPPPAGGIAVHVLRLHQALRARGLEVRGVDIGAGGQARPDVLATRSAVHLLGEVHRATQDGALVHLHTSGNNAKSFAVALAVGAAAGPGSVLTLHSGLLPGFLAPRRSRSELARTACGRFQAVLCVSTAQQEALERSGVIGTEVVSPFIDGPLMPESPWPELLRLCAHAQPLVAVACHPSPVYGTQLALETIELLRRRWPLAKLVLFGPGTEELAHAERTQSDDEASVEWLGELSPSRALAVIGAADVFLRPTRADGDALSVREALALGVRCVASDAVPRPRGVVTFTSNRAEECARAIELALTLPAPTPEGVGSLSQILEVYRRVRTLAPPREGVWAATL